MDPARSRGTRAVLPLLLLLAWAISGCNLFSFTHDEGGSDDPEILLQDAEDALLDRDWDRALEFALKGIENDPAPMQFPRLRYVATQATLAKSNISIASYLNVFTNTSKASGATPGHPRIQERVLDLSLEELLAIAESCPQAVAFLREILDALEAGDIGPEDLLGIQFDVELGFSVGAMLTVLITTLDQNQDLSDGFTLNEDVTIETFPQGGYTFFFRGENTSPAARDFILNNIVCPFWVRPATAGDGDASFCEALEGVWDAYRLAVGISSPTDIGCDCTEFGALPVTPDTTLIIGQVLEFMHTGLSLLYEEWARFCDPCPPSLVGGAQ